MKRTFIGDGTWFDMEAAMRFDPSAEDMDDEILYKTRKGNWIHAKEEVAGKLEYVEYPAHMAYEWLADNGHDDQVPDSYLTERER